ncbi:beta strand repeat-containing protein [Chryseobacterium sp. CP-77]|uniref:beta strand repeat-containing protein n=1 Tax=Chryseobacterium sp. CP-77 TaxID=3116594 RepID=UPI002ED671E5
MMKKKLLLTSIFIMFSLAAKSQVGINTSNPQGIFSVDGMKNNPTSGVPTSAQAKDDLVMTPNGNLGLGLIAPGTTLDVNGAITNRETALAVAGNAVTIPANVSLVQLTGAATSAVVITAPAAPNPGQRLIVYNNTTGGFGAALGGVTIPNGKALEYVYSNSGWRSTDGGSGTTSTNIYTADGTLTGNRIVTQGANTLAFTGTQTNAFSVDGNTLSVDAANDRVGLGTTTPDTKLTISTPDNSFGLNHTNGTVNLKTYIGGGVVSVGTTTANDLRFTTNNTQKMTITSGGNVGVGTVTPTNKLVIAGSNAQPSAQGTATTNATLRVDGSSNHALDFGTYANSPYGSYISSQNKTAAAGLPLVLNPEGGNVGINTTPGTALDVNGAITNREIVLAVSGNTVTVPPNVGQVQLTGTATGTITINAFAAPNAGQRLVVFNNTSGGFGATLNGVTVPNGKALEYVFSNSNWRSTDGGTVGVSSANIGDIKASFSVSDHSGWVKLDGRPVGGLTTTQRAAANSLGFSSYIPNASNSYLVQDGTRLGSINSNNSRVIARNQLPNFQLSGNTSSAEPTIMYDIINNNGKPATDTYSYTFLAGKIGTGTRNLDHVNTNVLHQNPHSHSFTTNSVNGGVAQQSINIQPQSLSVNMFVYLGK